MLIIALFACATDGEGDHADYEGGNFTFTTQSVDDQCADGAFETIFMPEGEDVPTAWEYAVELPGSHDLPASYSIQVQEPYGVVAVTVTEGASEDQMGVAGDAVEIELEDYPGCVVTQAISGTITWVDADNIQGSVVLSTTGMDEPECPSQPGSCTVTLDITGARAE
jgi:hypothetical protein